MRNRRLRKADLRFNIAGTQTRSQRSSFLRCCLGIGCTLFQCSQYAAPSRVGNGVQCAVQGFFARRHGLLGIARKSMSVNVTGSPQDAWSALVLTAQEPFSAFWCPIHHKRVCAAVNRRCCAVRNRVQDNSQFVRESELPA